jgi:hypothetical protein
MILRSELRPGEIAQIERLNRIRPGARVGQRFRPRRDRQRTQILVREGS